MRFIIVHAGIFMHYLINKCRVTAALMLGMALFTLLMPWPGQAGRMLWSTVDTPSGLFNTIVNQSEISSLAMSTDGRTFYAADTANSMLYMSDDAGISWLEISRYLASAGAVLPVWNISLSPGNPQFIAAVTSTGGMPRSIFVSQDGGQSWADTNFTVAANISALAISPAYGYFDIAAGTRSAGAGDVYIYRASGGSGGTWTAQGLTGDVLAIRFPLNYRADSSIAVLYATGVGTYFNIGLHDLNANTTNWTALYNGSPPEVATAGAGTSPRFNQVITGDLELPADYSGQAPSLGRAYMSLDSAGGNAGIFRIDGTVIYQLLVATANKRISSIAYFGTYASGKLLAGEVSGDPLRASVPVWYTDAPMVCPETCWYTAEKPPTGGATSGYANAQVIWGADGSRAYCGTSSARLNSPAAWPSGYLTGAALDESAFSTSGDNGRTWNQLSLIDTQINFLSDVAVTADSSAVYIASINTGGAGLDSVWRSGSQITGKSWDRVLCLPSATNDLILRTSTYGNDQAIFLASRGTDDLRQSQDGGQNWKTQLPGKIVTDFSVTSINNTRYLYVLSGSYIRKANVTSLIPQWSQAVTTTLTSGHTVFAAPNNVVVAGGDTSDSRVAYSIDGGNSFTATPAFPVQGRIHALADYRLGRDVIIYAAADSPGSDIYWIAGASPGWDVMGAPSTQFWGLAQMGTLYGASTTTVLPAVDRTLSPESLGPPGIEWDTLSTGLTPGTAFTREPTSLKLSSGINLWAIDNRAYNYDANTGRLWTFCDCLSPTPQYKPPPPPTKEVLFAPPIAVSPRPDDLIPIFIADNSVGEITLQWKHNTTAVAYEVRVAADKGFTNIIAENVVKPQRRAPSWTIADKKGFEPSKTYYWQVRVVQAANGEKDTGQWSETAQFTIAENKPEAAGIPPIAPDNKSPDPANPAAPISPGTADNVSAAKAGYPITDLYLWIYVVSGLLAGLLITVLAISIVTKNRR